MSSSDPCERSRSPSTREVQSPTFALLREHELEAAEAEGAPEHEQHPGAPDRGEDQRARQRAGPIRPVLHPQRLNR